VLASFSPAVDKTKSAENRRNETAMASKNARKEAGDKQSALQREIEEAMEDGVITEEEQMGIDARKAELAAAKKVQDKATAAATSAADEARATLARAQVEASEMLRKSQHFLLLRSLLLRCAACIQRALSYAKSPTSAFISAHFRLLLKSKLLTCSNERKKQCSNKLR